MTVTITKPTVGGSEGAWGTLINTALDDIVDVLNGIDPMTPDLTSFDIGGVPVTATAAEINILSGATVTTAEINYVDGVTSNIQTQLDALDTGKQDADVKILKADTSDNLTAGYTATADNDGTQSSGTYRPTPLGGNLKRTVNGGAFTLAAPTATVDYTLVIQMTNNASAGTITVSGFSKQSGDSLTTTDGDDFFLFITKINGFTSLTVQALQ